MTPEQSLAISPRILTQAQRELYFSEVYRLLERAIGEEWIARLRAATDELIERSRRVSRSDAVWDLEPDHRPDAPRLRRVSAPVDQHPVFWEYVSQSVMGDIVADLIEIAWLPEIIKSQREALIEGLARLKNRLKA